VIDTFVHFGDVLGVPKSVAEIYGFLFASARPLAFQEIVVRLRLSKGSVSQGLRLLRGIGAVRLVYVAGRRRDHFVPETELRALLSGLLREKVRPHLEGGLARVDALAALARTTDLGAGDSGDARVLRQRADKLRAWHRKARTVVPIVIRLFG
jgi:DNA-binding transcriptional regulator GbsR (MarR family)